MDNENIKGYTKALTKFMEQARKDGDKVEVDASGKRIELLLYNTDKKSIILPNCIASIRGEAFIDCDNLNQIYFGSSMTSLCGELISDTYKHAIHKFNIPPLVRAIHDISKSSNFIMELEGARKMIRGAGLIGKRKGIKAHIVRSWLIKKIEAYGIVNLNFKILVLQDVITFKSSFSDVNIDTLIISSDTKIDKDAFSNDCNIGKIIVKSSLEMEKYINTLEAKYETLGY